MFTFWLNAGSVDERMSGVAREAQIHNEKPKPFEIKTLEIDTVVRTVVETNLMEEIG